LKMEFGLSLLKDLVEQQPLLQVHLHLQRNK
jgi:hypothetical protein